MTTTRYNDTSGNDAYRSMMDQLAAKEHGR